MFPGQDEEEGEGGKDWTRAHDDDDDHGEAGQRVGKVGVNSRYCMYVGKQARPWSK